MNTPIQGKLSPTQIPQTPTQSTSSSQTSALTTAKPNTAAFKSGITPESKISVIQGNASSLAPSPALMNFEIAVANFAQTSLHNTRQALSDAKKGLSNFIQSTKTAFLGEKKEIDNSAPSKPKTVLPEVLLKAMWSGSSMAKGPVVKDTITRSELKDSALKPVEIKTKEFTIKKESSEHTRKFEEAKQRYQNYSVFPTYPTRPVELTASHFNVLHDLTSNGTQQIKEAAASLVDGKTLYKDLSPDAIKLLNQVNLTLVKQHLADIETLANHAGNVPDLSHLGMNYFENEIYDTLARGLAFIDKNMINNSTIEVPVKQPNGTFELKEFNIDRFNISATGQDKVDHNVGHPIFFLTPKTGGDGPPMIVARGTLLMDDGNDGAKEGVQADGRKDISMKWVAGNAELADKMQNIQQYGKAVVCGHSLGGNVALNLAARFPGSIESVTTISAPQVSKDVYDLWKSIPPENRPKVTNIMVEGDIIPSGGQEIIGHVFIAEQQKDGKPDHAKNPVDRHLQPFNNNDVRYAVVDKEKETGKATRALASVNVTVAGRTIQEKEGISILTGTGTREHALGQIKMNLRTLQETPIGVGDHPLSVFEHASPAQIRQYCKESNIDWKGLTEKLGKENISPELYLKIYISLEKPLQEGVPFLNELRNADSPNMKNANSLISLYDRQKDPYVDNR